MKTIFTIFIALILSLSVFSQRNGYLGVTLQKTSLEGVRISDVLENGSAFVYGLEQNDIILSINGIDVNSVKEVISQIKKYNWAQTITVSYSRDGNTKSKDLVLGNRANKVTYHIKREVNSTNIFTWNFDEHTWVNIENGNAKWIKKKLDGITQTYVVESFRETPQVFSDLDEKLDIIEFINKRNAGKSKFPPVTVYVRNYPEHSKLKENTSLNSELVVFPNPSLGQFQFSLDMEDPKSKNLSWQVFDVTGKKITEGNLNEFSGKTNQKLDLTTQGAGVYLLRITNDKEVMTERLVIK
ncbi:PDZ domain-containing protein [Flavobacteriales bacterium]|nr:PDZ domain-containing protein [Flavobacteriales bacterium]